MPPFCKNYFLLNCEYEIWHYFGSLRDPVTEKNHLKMSEKNISNLPTILTKTDR